MHVYVPASKDPVQIEMSTADVATAATLLEQLRAVVGEVAGRPSPLAPEELSVVYEDDRGVQVELGAESALRRVYVASRVVASIVGARAANARCARSLAAGADAPTAPSCTRL